MKKCMTNYYNDDRTSTNIINKLNKLWFYIGSSYKILIGQTNREISTKQNRIKYLCSQFKVPTLWPNRWSVMHFLSYFQRDSNRAAIGYDRSRNRLLPAAMSSTMAFWQRCRCRGNTHSYHRRPNSKWYETIEMEITIVTIRYLINQKLNGNRDSRGFERAKQSPLDRMVPF